jgi:hypothetical protein
MKRIEDIESELQILNLILTNKRVNGMKYMVADLMFPAEKAWYENGMICIILSGKKKR